MTAMNNFGEEATFADSDCISSAKELIVLRNRQDAGGSARESLVSGHQLYNQSPRNARTTAGRLIMYFVHL